MTCALTVYLMRTLVFVHFMTLASNLAWGAYPKHKGGGYIRTQGGKVKSTLKSFRSPGRIPEMESGGGCFGLPDKDCAGAGHDWMTPDTIRQCKISFCMPLCIQAVKCHVIASGDFAIAGAGEYSNALCRQVIGQACVDTGCCNGKDSGGYHMIYDWVMRSTSSDSNSANELLPMDVCARDSENEAESAKRCAACEAAGIKVKLEIDENVCCKYMAECDHRTWNPLHKHYEDEFTIQKLGTEERSDVSKFWHGYIRNTFARQGSDGGLWNSLHERCKHFLSKIGPMMKVAAVKFNAKICKCMGCCDDSSGENACNFDSFTEA